MFPYFLLFLSLFNLFSVYVNAKIILNGSGDWFAFICIIASFVAFIICGFVGIKLLKK